MGVYQSARAAPRVVASTPRVTISARHAKPARLVVAGASVATAVATALLDDALLTTRPLFALATAIGAGTTVFFLLQRRVLERDLRRARVRSVKAMDLERQRIQRDLHDSAQQRIISVKIRLAMIADTVPTSDREALERIGHELDDALGEIRAVTWGNLTAQLHRLGVAASLRTLAASTPVPVTVEVDGFGRYSPRVERSVYFCCAEALQNVVKHAGPRAAARIRLSHRQDCVSFEVEDTGRGFDPHTGRRGEGIRNISDRVAALNGRSSIDSRPGFGTLVRGEIPIAAREGEAATIVPAPSAPVESLRRN
jgi:signal transduction histidine kinase